MSSIEPQLIYPILKCFYDSGRARAKLFIKMQQHIVSSLSSLEVNEVCAILRLYAEMGVEQASFVEALGEYLESHIG